MKSSPVIVGIDPGTSCGWAVRGRVVNGRRLWMSGTWRLAPGRFEGGGMRYVRLRHYLETLLWDLKSEHLKDEGKVPFTDDPWCLVFYEEVRRHLGTDAAHIYGGIVAIITEQCEAFGVPYLGVPVKTVKKTATGKGNANKGMMIEATKARWPDFDGDDNEADARWIALAGLAEVGQV